MRERRRPATGEPERAPAPPRPPGPGCLVRGQVHSATTLSDRLTGLTGSGVPGPALFGFGSVRFDVYNIDDPGQNVKGLDVEFCYSFWRGPALRPARLACLTVNAALVARPVVLAKIAARATDHTVGMFDWPVGEIRFAFHGLVCPFVASWPHYKYRPVRLGL